MEALYTGTISLDDKLWILSDLESELEKKSWIKENAMEHYKITEYIENLQFRKRVGGVDQGQVYEAIRELSAMYNELLSEAYLEIEKLKSELESENAFLKDYHFQTESEIAKEYEESMEHGVEVPLEKQVQELRRLKRKDLLEILLDQSRENENQKLLLSVQKEKIIELEHRLYDRHIDIAESGTLAEASLRLNGVFAAAQEAAQQYLDNLKTTDVRCEAMERATKERCEAMKEDAARKCAALEAETQRNCELQEKKTEERCEELNRRAKEEVDKRWDELSTKLETFYSAHAGLKELLSSAGDILR